MSLADLLVRAQDSYFYDNDGPLELRRKANSAKEFQETSSTWEPLWSAQILLVVKLTTGQNVSTTFSGTADAKALAEGFVLKSR